MIVNKTLNNLYDLGYKIQQLQEDELEPYATEDTAAKYDYLVFKTVFCGKPKIYSNLNCPIVTGKQIGRAHV